MEILISIIVPTYNRATLISNTINSLLNQDYHNYEIIIVDDGSTDNTEVVVNKFTNPKIKYYKKKNEERGAARNYGVLQANGEYINFFDSDDIAFPNHLSIAINAIKKLNYPEIFHLGYYVVSEKKILRTFTTNGPLNELIQKQNKLSCNSVFLRKDIAEQFPFSTVRALSVSEDALLWLKLSARFIIHGIPLITSSIIQHDQRSMITDPPEKTLRRMNLLVDELKKDEQYMLKYGNKYLPFIQSEKLSLAALLYALNGKKTSAINVLFRALKTTPSLLFSRRFLAVVKYLLIKW